MSPVIIFSNCSAFRSTETSYGEGLLKMIHYAHKPVQN